MVCSPSYSISEKHVLENSMLTQLPLTTGGALTFISPILSSPWFHGLPDSAVLIYVTVYTGAGQVARASREQRGVFTKMNPLALLLPGTSLARVADMRNQHSCY